MTRTHLPPTRESVTHKFRLGAQECYLTVGLTPDGQPMEVFVKISKHGGTLSGLLDSFCRAFSLALQYGLPLDKAVGAFRDMRFEPMGDTDDPDIPNALSLVDYIVRWLARHWPETAAPQKREEPKP